MAGNSKNALTPYHVINAVSMGATITGAAVNIQYLDNISIQLIFTGSPVGTVSLEGSLSYAQSSTGAVINAGTWTPLGVTYAISAAGDLLIDLNEMSFPWIRIKYTRSSGSGTLDGYISGKAI